MDWIIVLTLTALFVLFNPVVCPLPSASTSSPSSVSTSLPSSVSTSSPSSASTSLPSSASTSSPSSGSTSSPSSGSTSTPSSGSTSSPSSGSTSTPSSGSTSSPSSGSTSSPSSGSTSSPSSGSTSSPSSGSTSSPSSGSTSSPSSGSTSTPSSGSTSSPSSGSASSPSSGSTSSPSSGSTSSPSSGSTSSPSSGSTSSPSSGSMSSPFSGSMYSPSRPVYSTDLESSLREELFTTNGYEVLQRPQELVQIQISLTILTVNDLNIKDQALSISAYLTVIWKDARLDWSNSSTTKQDYRNVKFLFSTETYVWKPALIIENSVKDIGIISDTTIPMRIVSDGTVVWNPSGIYEVSCESDTTYYPLDTQECTVKVSSWAYTSGEVELLFGSEPVDLTFYSPNGEWDLIAASGSTSESNSRGGISFSGLSYSIKLRRRPMFHIINTLFPVALVAVLIAMVFKLPVDSGEKIGFALTVLLAYAVYLTMISDNIPSTSVTTCYLSVYLVFILTLGAASVVFTIFVLRLHFKSEDDDIPDWLHTFTDKCLLKMACMQNCWNCRRKSTTPVEELKPYEEKGNKKMLVFQTGKFPVVKARDELTWQRLAKIFDKVFFNVYMCMITVFTSMLFITLFANYYSY